MQYPDRRHEFRPSMFIHGTARILYDSIQEVFAEGGVPDASSIAVKANKKSSKLKLEVVKSLLFGGEEDFTFVEHDAGLIKKELESSEIRARIHKDLKEAVAEMEQASVPDTAFFDSINKKLTKAQMETMLRSGSPLITINEAFDTYEKELDEREEGLQIASGDLLLDRALVRGLAGGQIITIAGATGNGKSLYMLNLMNGFMDLGIPAIYITLEMDMISTLDRLSALRTQTPIKDWYDPQQIVNLRRKLQAERKKMEGMTSVEIVEDPSLSLADVSSIISEFRSKHQIPLKQRIIVGIDLVTQLKDFATGQRGYSLANNYELAVNLQHAISKTHNICFLNAVQFNRDADSVDLQEISDLRKTRPSLNNIKNSHAIAERSRVVLSTWRPYYYATRYLTHLEDELDTMEDIMYVQVLKQSQGEVGMDLSYKFNGSHGEIVPTFDESTANTMLGAARTQNSALTQEERAVYAEMHGTF